MKCGCGNELMTGDSEGICTRCQNVMNHAEQWSQKFTFAILPEIRACALDLIVETAYDFNGNIVDADNCLYIKLSDVEEILSKYLNLT